MATFQVLVVEGIEICVIRTQLNEEIFGMDNVLALSHTRLIASTGGALAMRKFDNEEKEFRERIQQAYGAEAAKMVRKNIVVLFEDMLRKLSDSEKKSLLWHELGHHVKGIPVGGPTSTEGFIDSLEDELFADAFAAERFGNKTVSRAVVKTVYYGALMLLNLEKRSIWNYLRAFAALSHPTIKTRLKALRG